LTTPEKVSPGFAATAAPARLVDTPGAFDSLVRELGTPPLLAVDTEAASFHRYHDRVYLLQLSTRELTAVVDPLTVTDLTPLARLLGEPAVEVVFHDADYDLRILDRDYGFRAARLFDTRIAAQFVNEPGIGLAALLEKYLGVRLDKKFQRADWSIRPLSQGMLDYAAADTRYLPQLRDILRARLDELGRLEWAEEEFELLERVRWTGSTTPEEAYLRLKGAKTLRGRSLLVLREVYNWREDAAGRADRATFRIMNPETVLAIGKAAPRTLETLRGIPGMTPDQVNRRGAEILAAVERGLALPDSEIPVFERGRRPAPDPAFDARLERLKAARNAAAERLALAPGVLCPNGTLEAIARVEPKTPEQLRGVDGVRRWQVEALGKDLLTASAA